LHIPTEHAPLAGGSGGIVPFDHRDGGTPRYELTPHMNLLASFRPFMLEHGTRIVQLLRLFER
jgi:hypothetical protein